MKNKNKGKFLKTDVELAKYLNRSTRSIAYYKNENKNKGILLPEEPEGGYWTDKIDAWLAERKKKQEGVNHKIPEESMSDARRKLRVEIEVKKIEKKLKDLKLKEAQGALISRDEVYEQWTARIAEFKRGLELFGNKLAPLLEMKEKREIKRILDDEVWNLLDQYSRKGKYCPKKNA